MTHRPRTDLFSSLPNLIALATLLDQHQHFEELNAVRLQAEAIQLAKLQYLQSLLQSNTTVDLSALNSINSSFPSPNDQFENNNNNQINSFSNIENNNSQLLHHMVDPAAQVVPFDFQTHLNGSSELGSEQQADVIIKTMDNNSSSSSSWFLPPLTEASSSSSNGGADQGASNSDWPAELFFEDTYNLHELS